MAEIRANQKQQYSMVSLPMNDGTKLAYYELGDGKLSLVRVRPDVNHIPGKYEGNVFVTLVKVVDAD